MSYAWWAAGACNAADTCTGWRHHKRPAVVAVAASPLLLPLLLSLSPPTLCLSLPS